MLKREARWELRQISVGLRGRHPEACVDGSPCSASNRVAYCWCGWHRGYLTTNLLKRRRCLKKSCGALQRLPHGYWARREKAKADLRKRREMDRQAERRDAGFLRLAREYARDNYIDDAYVTTAKLVRPGLIRITYIGAYSKGLYGLDAHMGAATRCKIWLWRAKSDESVMRALIPGMR